MRIVDAVHATPAHAVTEANVASYWRDGAVLLRDVFSADWIASLRDGVEQVRADPAEGYHWYAGGPGEERVFFNVSRSWPRITAFRRFIWESGIAEMTARIARSPFVDLLWDGVFYRTEGLDQPTPWHQDAPYWPVEGDKIVSVWMPLDPALEHSVLGFVRGSHRMGPFERPSFRDGGRSPHFSAGDRSDAIPLPDIDAGASGFEVVRQAMNPSDCLVFHGFALHGSPGNKDDARKLRAVTFRFAGDGTTFVERPEGTSPSFGAGVFRPGEPIGGELFPRVWPQPPIAI